MADDKRTDIDRLLAEVEGTLGGKPAGASTGRDVEQVDGTRRGLAARARTAAVAGAFAGAGVFLLFMLLPFLRAPSGAVGAFLGAFVAALLLRRK
jgi:hypothetical protein